LCINFTVDPSSFAQREEEFRMSALAQATAADPIVVFGVANIGPHIGRATAKATYCALESGKIPGAKKVGGKWALNLAVYHASFQAKAA
jgi:hypothetical protein